MIDNPSHIATFLGKRIAVQDEHNKKMYRLYTLYGILSNGSVIVADLSGCFYVFEWGRLENTYFVLQDGTQWEVP
jgi:hypothetical protein